MAFPPLPPRPKDRWGNPVNTVASINTVFGQLMTAIGQTAPNLLTRAGAKIDYLRSRYGG
jgi:hypothetical protein